ncbi:MAG: sodium:solute symporter family protein [Luminiphilus sp.]|nr:sodium:solute symporter family protein [Luminiphilus sp.]CAI8441693.1 MAG: Sodium/pantothenate symporter [Halieaceae bacterium]|tara:strand:- start:420 stop:2087 length:1668 start_codon:yes stop_codon:yes gene_type:complete
MNSFQLGIVASLVCYLAIGWYAGKRVRHLEDFFVAGRNAPTILILGTLVASFMSTNAFMGEAGMSYQGHAPLVIIMTCFNCLGYIVGAVFFGRYLRRSEALTVPAFFRARFNSRRIQMFAGISIVVGLSAYLLAVTWGMALIITEVTGFSEVAAILLVWISYTLFTLYSGSRGVILTDTVMFLLFSAIIVITCFFIVDAAGGWFSAIQSLAVYEAKPGIIAWHGRIGPDVYWQTEWEALIWASILGVAWGIVVAVSPWQTSRYLMARSEHVVLRSACGALIAMLLLYLITNFAAATVNLINPDITPAESTMIWVAMNLLPAALGAVLICGVLAAGLSSASTFLSLVGFSVSHDILGSSSEQGSAGGDNNTESRLHLRAARLAMLMVGLSVIGLALLLPRNIYWLTHFAGPLFASSWGVVAFMSIWSERLTEAGAFWGMVAGFGVNVTMNALSLAGWVQWPVVADPILVGVVSSYLVVRVVSNRGVVSVTEANYREALHRMPPQERDPAVIRQTLVWPKVMVAMGAMIAVALTLFYAVPYRQAIASTEQVVQEVAL